MRKCSTDPVTQPVPTFQRQFPVWLIRCASVRDASLRRKSSSARLRSVMSTTAAAKSGALPTIGTWKVLTSAQITPPSLRRYRFSTRCVTGSPATRAG